jgi:hypothetical protein
MENREALAESSFLLKPDKREELLYPLAEASGNLKANS